MIDIVVPYCTDKDVEWKNLRDKYLKEEGTTDRQATGEERYRDWDCFKYWFRCVERNCDWCNKIFLLVASTSQIPEWLDVNHPKLRIVYHEEFIPKVLLPTFNASTIELFIPNIADLSDNYIYCNDDFYFINYLPSEAFFMDNRPVYNDAGTHLVLYRDELLNGSDGTFYKTLNNNNMQMQLLIAGNKAKKYEIGHLPIPHKKDVENDITDEWYTHIISSQFSSKFRHPNNLSNHVYTCLYRDLYPYIKSNVYYNSYYVTLKSDVDFDKYLDADMVCFNDTEQLDDFELTKKKLIEFFEKKFPYKSEFEV